jgi:4-amino-4-deoxy-L-arabinose transferase-like glycosyltransferase
MMGKEKARLQQGALALILLLAGALRLYCLGAESLWYDETVSVYLAGESIPALVAHTAGDIHPPGYYLLLHAWTRLAGSSEFAAAFLSLFCGVLLVALAYRLAARTFGPAAGLLAAFLVAISPYNLWYSQEVRMYTLGAVLGLGVLGAVLPLVTRPVRRDKPWGRLAVYALCGALGLWTLYYFAFLLVAVNLLVGVWWLVERRRERVGWGWLGRWALAQAAVLLLYAPWLPVAWRQATTPPVPPWRGFTPLGKLLLETWSALSLGQSVQPAQVWPVLLLFLALFGLGLLARDRRPARSPRLPWLLAGYVFLPVLLIYLASFATPLYHVRYAFTYSTPFYVLVGAGLAALPRLGREGKRRWPGRAALWLSLAVIAVFSGISIGAYHTDPRYASDDHRAAVRFLADRWRPGDVILVNAGYAYTALVTYWDGDPIAWRGRLLDQAGQAARQGPVVVQTGTVDGSPSLGWGKPESDFYAMSQAETVEALTRLFADFDRVWVYRIYDTVTDPLGLIRAWLAQHGTPFEDQVFSGESQLRVQGFLTGRDPLAGADQPVGASLADGSLQLLASSPLPPEVKVGGALDLALAWRVASPPAEDALLFAGLFDEAGRRWAQSDERPLGSLYPVAQWPAGAVVRTPLRVTVPPGTPPGRYRLEVGWYRFAAGQPIWLPWPSGERWLLGSVACVAPDDWSSLPPPEFAHPSGVTVGAGLGLRLLGFTLPLLEGRPGDTLLLDLVWQALADAPAPGPVVLQLTDDAGRVLAETSSAPVGGQVPFAALSAGQALRDPQALSLPGGLAPGVYTLAVGRRDPGGAWLPIRRGPFPLGATYSLATIRVLGRDVVLAPPNVQHPLDARLGDSLRLVGYDLQGPASSLQSPSSPITLTLYWQAIGPMAARYKIFVHLVGDGGPADIRVQADVWPHLPTTGWLPGEYLSDLVTLDLPADLPPGRYTPLVGLYDETTGRRLPVLDAAGQGMGDSLALEPIQLGE